MNKQPIVKYVATDYGEVEREEYTRETAQTLYRYDEWWDREIGRRKTGDDFDTWGDARKHLIDRAERAHEAAARKLNIAKAECIEALDIPISEPKEATDATS